jgi:uncharacterized protein YyaL (SSP411 family)
MDHDLRFDHLLHMSTPLGVYEHALLSEPRPEHAMCVDDVARALVVTVRGPDRDPQVGALAATCLQFLLDALHDDGSMHNRRNLDGTWGDEASTDDHWGRALWALGTAAARASDPLLAQRALEGAQRAMRSVSPWHRASAYAALGAALVLQVSPEDDHAHRHLRHARTLLLLPRADAAWPWPEDVLTYANAVIPEAMVVVGRQLGDDGLRLAGLDLLEWLVEEQTLGGHLSVVPAHGRRRGDGRPGFDQQPIEVATLAEACRTAYEDTGDPQWAGVVELAAAWFEGDNDAGLEMRDAQTGAGYDGLERSSVNLNQGAESTLAWLSTQQLRLLGVVVATR